MLKSRLFMGLAIMLLPAAVLAAAAQPFPTHPIRLIVPYPPGGPTDLVGRTVNELLARRLGQPVVVDNRGGAATVIGTELAARAPADGYTLLVATVTTLAVNPAISAKLPYDAARDFVPISMLAVQPYLLGVHASVPATSVAQLVAYAKANPGKLSFASAGVGAGAHLAGEMFKYMAAIDVVHVPYKGTGPALNDLIGGQVSYMFGGISAIYPHTQNGKLRALAVSSAKRSPAVPEIPTVAEGGLAGYGTTSWNSLVAPRGTPQAIIDRLNAEVNVVFAQPEVKERLKRQGIDADPGTQEQLAAHIQSEQARFRQLVKTIGLTGVE
ncbi:MAG: Bug family tripartite tricarboxylate transporter substrate binding protein [Burkholderiales bacterium]